MDERQSKPDIKDDYVLDEQVGYVLRLANQRHAGFSKALSIKT